MVDTYQQLPEVEQPAAFHLLQASLGPLLAIPAEYVLPDQPQSGQHLIITDQQHVVAQQQSSDQQEQLSTSSQDHQHITAHGEQMVADHEQKFIDQDYGTEESDDLMADPDDLPLKQESQTEMQMTEEQDTQRERGHSMTGEQQHASDR